MHHLGLKSDGLKNVYSMKAADFNSKPEKLASGRLFVAQAFDRIQARGADRGQHAADDTHQAEDDGCHNEAADIDVEVNVTGLCAFAESAHQG
jgi:hypothetical protein